MWRAPEKLRRRDHNFEPPKRLDQRRSPWAANRQSPESIAKLLRQAESGIPIAELARKAGVHENTVHLWKKKYGTLGTPEIRQINELRDEIRDSSVWSPISRSTRSCCRTCFQNSSEAGQAAQLGRRTASNIRCEPTPHLRDDAIQPQVDAVQAEVQCHQRGVAQPHQRVGSSACPLWISPHPRAFASRGWKVNPKRIARLYRQEGLVYAQKIQSDVAVRQCSESASRPRNRITFGVWTSCMIG